MEKIGTNYPSILEKYRRKRSTLRDWSLFPYFWYYSTMLCSCDGFKVNWPSNACLLSYPTAPTLNFRGHTIFSNKTNPSLSRYTNEQWRPCWEFSDNAKFWIIWLHIMQRKSYSIIPDQFGSWSAKSIIQNRKHHKKISQHCVLRKAHLFYIIFKI